MSVGKNSISRISAGTAPKKKAPAKKSPELTPAVEEVKAEVAAPAPAKKPTAKKAAPKKVKSNAFKIYQVSDELPYYLL
jgi:hypothetical protein